MSDEDSDWKSTLAWGVAVSLIIMATVSCEYVEHRISIEKKQYEQEAKK